MNLLDEMLVRIDINIVAFLVLVFMWVIAVRRQDRNDMLGRIFRYMIVVAMTNLALETSTVVIDGQPGVLNYMLGYFLNILLFSAGPLLMLLWSIFIDFWIFHDRDRVIKKATLMAIPLFLNVLLTVSAPLNGWVFTVSTSNVYQRGQAFFIPVGLSYLFVLYSMIFTYANRRHLKLNEYIPLLVFTVPTLAGGILQALHYGLLLIWSSSAFTLTIMYVYLQQRMTQVDPLTGAWTRGTLDWYLDRRINRTTKAGSFAAVMIDLDNFKKINDTFGHTEGDFALKSVGRILRMALRREDIVARYGGDEFVILLEMSENKDVEKIVERINQGFESWNSVPDRRYKLEYSCGYSIYLQDSSLTMDEFLFRVDSLMYASKYERKQKKMQPV